MGTTRRSSSARGGRTRPWSRIHVWRGAAVVTLAAGDMEAAFVPSLGMLGAVLRWRGEDVLALPGGLGGYRRQHTTGLPLLAPWANRLSGRRYRAAGVTVDLDGLDLHTDAGGLPIHGTMTAQHGWEIVHLAVGHASAGLSASFDYGARPDLLAAFPFPHQLRFDVRLAGSGLVMDTILRPTGRRRVPVSFGFHPYFRLPHGRRAAWRLRLPARHRLELDGEGLPTGASERLAAEERPLGARTFDDLFALGNDRRLWIEGGGRRLTLRLERGYPFAQVFAPPGRRMVALEPMTAPTNALMTGACPLVAPGDAFRARFRVSVEASA